MSNEQLLSMLEAAFYAGMARSKYAPESPPSSFRYWYRTYQKENTNDNT
jgi:hypothetical protein